MPVIVARGQLQRMHRRRPPGPAWRRLYVESQEFGTTGGVGTTPIIDGADVCDADSLTPGPVVKLSDRSSLRGFVIEHGGDSGVQAFGAVTVEKNIIDANATPSVGGGLILGTGVNLSDPNRQAPSSRRTRSATTRRPPDGAGIYVDASASGRAEPGRDHGQRGHGEHGGRRHGAAALGGGSDGNHRHGERRGSVASSRSPATSFDRNVAKNPTAG